MGYATVTAVVEPPTAGAFMTAWSEPFIASVTLFADGDINRGPRALVVASVFGQRIATDNGVVPPEVADGSNPRVNFPAHEGNENSVNASSAKGAPFNKSLMEPADTLHNAPNPLRRAAWNAEAGG